MTSAAEGQIDVATADLLLSTTRAVRRRLDFDRPVPREVLLECVALAQQAPTGGNAQGWSWVIVTDADKRAALADIYRDASAEYFAAMTADDPQTQRVLASARYLRDNFHRAPVHVIPCIQGRRDAVTPAAAPGFYGSILPAAWSFCLALRARGLGSAWTTLHLRLAERAAELLGIPEDYIQCALLPVAYTLGTTFRPAERPAPETIVHWDGW
jgi:nitroreductase